MNEELKQGAEMVKEQEKLLVPVRRFKVNRQAEQKIQEESQPVKQWERPRRWYVY